MRAQTRSGYRELHLARRAVHRSHHLAHYDSFFTIAGLSNSELCIVAAQANKPTAGTCSATAAMIQTAPDRCTTLQTRAAARTSLFMAASSDAGRCRGLELTRRPVRTLNRGGRPVLSLSTRESSTVSSQILGRAVPCREQSRRRLV